jgi:hypothetical protein
MEPSLSREVQMQYMRPAQLQEALRRFPVVYVPFGLIEWHGRHLPLGNDAIKAHGILVKCAEQYGGVVYPPLYFPSASYREDGRFSEADMAYKVPLLTDLFERLKQTGFRVIIGVSGHNIAQQIEMIDRALCPVTADGTITGMGLQHHVLLSRVGRSLGPGRWSPGPRHAATRWDRRIGPSRACLLRGRSPQRRASRQGNRIEGQRIIAVSSRGIPLNQLARREP